MRIPYHHQERIYTCGAASLRMAFEALGIKKTEKQMARLLGTNKIKGTWEKDFPRLAERYKLKYSVEHNGSINDLKKLYKKGYILIVCFYDRKEREDHYAVVKKINSKEIHLLDPWNGPDKMYKISNFKKMWKTISEKDLKWFIALKKGEK